MFFFGLFGQFFFCVEKTTCSFFFAFFFWGSDGKRQSAVTTRSGTNRSPIGSPVPVPWKKWRSPVWYPYRPKVKSGERQSGHLYSHVVWSFHQCTCQILSASNLLTSPGAQVSSNQLRGGSARAPSESPVAAWTQLKAQHHPLTITTGTFSVSGPLGSMHDPRTNSVRAQVDSITEMLGWSSLKLVLIGVKHRIKSSLFMPFLGFTGEVVRFSLWLVFYGTWGWKKLVHLKKHSSYSLELLYHLTRSFLAQGRWRISCCPSFKVPRSLRLATLVVQWRSSWSLPSTLC